MIQWSYSAIIVKTKRNWTENWQASDIPNCKNIIPLNILIINFYLYRKKKVFKSLKIELITAKESFYNLKAGK